MNVEQIGFEEWSRALPSSGFEVFHAPEALKVVADHADGDCRLYAARKGQETIGLLPVFVNDRVVGKTVTSPPPGLSVPRLGPLLMPNSPKRGKRERLNKSLIKEVLDDVAVDEPTTLFRTLTPLGYDDPRPLAWNDLSIEPRFTYVVDLEGVSDIEDRWSSFSKSLRSEMRKLDELDVTIADEGRDGAHRIYQELRDRYREQSEDPPSKWSFVTDVVTALEDRSRAYVARDSTGRYLGGILVIYSNDRAYFWLGGVRNSYENVSVNTLVHRRIMDDIISDPELEPIQEYDLFGANTERLCEYKAKFDGDLAQYYVAESSGIGMTAAKTTYRFFSGESVKN